MGLLLSFLKPTLVVRRSQKWQTDQRYLSHRKFPLLLIHPSSLSETLKPIWKRE
jgi:hypothetical protein